MPIYTKFRVLRKTYNYGGASFELWEGIPVGRGGLNFKYVMNLSREPILNLRMGRKMSDHIRQGGGYGVVAYKIEDRDIAVGLCLRQSV
jgi:hypothetical protein